MKHPNRLPTGARRPGPTREWRVRDGIQTAPGARIFSGWTPTVVVNGSAQYTPCRNPARNQPAQRESATPLRA